MKNLYTAFCVVFSAITLLSCRKAEAQDETTLYPMTGFAVNAGSTWYHAKIDQHTGIAEIGGIKNPGDITDVDYILCEGAAITPDPKSDGWKWNIEQDFAVSCNGKTKNYKVLLTAVTTPDGQGLIFVDEFDVEGIPDPEKWSLCPKGNPDWCNQMSESYDQAYVKDGNLVLVGEKVGSAHLAGGIQSKDKFSFSFGRVECRARLKTHPNGAFPAIWMMPQRAIYSGWPACGEIDIMEHIKQENVIHQTIHTHYRNNLGFDEGTTAQTPCNYWDYVVYAVDWTPERLTFYVDGNETFTYSNMNIPNEAELMQWPFGTGASYYLILNMGLGDPGTWAGPIDDSGLPAIMEIDWIRVYQNQE